MGTWLTFLSSFLISSVLPARVRADTPFQNFRLCDTANLGFVSMLVIVYQIYVPLHYVGYTMRDFILNAFFGGDTGVWTKFLLLWYVGVLVVCDTGMYLISYYCKQSPGRFAYDYLISI